MRNHDSKAGMGVEIVNMFVAMGILLLKWKNVGVGAL
jgi:hypothetical protein